MNIELSFNKLGSAEPINLLFDREPVAKLTAEQARNLAKNLELAAKYAEASQAAKDLGDEMRNRLGFVP